MAYGSAAGAFSRGLIDQVARRHMQDVTDEELERRRQADLMQAEENRLQHQRAMAQQERMKEAFLYQQKQDELAAQDRATTKAEQKAKEERARQLMDQYRQVAGKSPEMAQAYADELAMLGVRVQVPQPDEYNLAPGHSRVRDGKIVVTAPDRDREADRDQMTAAQRRNEELLPQGVREWLDEKYQRGLTNPGFTLNEARKELARDWNVGWRKQHHPKASFQAANEYLTSLYQVDPQTRERVGLNDADILKEAAAQLAANGKDNSPESVSYFLSNPSNVEWVKQQIAAKKK